MTKHRLGKRLAKRVFLSPYKEKTVLKMNRLIALSLLAAGFLCILEQPLAKAPNILFAISDDQSYPHASAYGCRGIETPGFDRVAREGVLFHTAISGSPGCSPSRASLLTGRYHWMIEHALSLIHI